MLGPDFVSALYKDAIEIEPMKYRKEPDEKTIIKLLDSGDYLGQIKKDGIHQILQKTHSGIIYAWGRTVSKVTNELTMKIDHLPHIEEWMKSLPLDSIIAGELYYPNQTSKFVTRVMGALPEKAISRQDEYGPIHYYVFDVLRWDGQNLMDKPFAARYDLLKKIKSKYGTSDYIEFSEAFGGSGESMLGYAQVLIDQENEEGCVFKHVNGLYLPGKRPTVNFKYKKHKDSLDFVVTRTYDPELLYNGKEIETWPYWFVNDAPAPIVPRYELYKDNPCKYMPVTKAAYYGWCGAIGVGLYDDKGQLVEVGRVASGLTEEDKGLLAIQPNQFIGKVVSVSCMELDKQELTFRHPYKMAWHFDKNPHECTVKSVFG